MKLLYLLLWLPALATAQTEPKVKAYCDTLIIKVEPTLEQALQILKSHEGSTAAQYLIGTCPGYSVEGFNHRVIVILRNTSKLLQYYDIPYMLQSHNHAGKVLKEHRFIMPETLGPCQQDTMIVTIPFSFGTTRYTIVPDGPKLRFE